ncbi:MAG: ABC transporter ATP-binding protein/permease [Syntrophobacterales bacterium]|nr:ABC transporter ATP-binding protein/permease [Syntrophobacterales bacterium]
MNTNIFDRHLWRRFWEIARLYWFSNEKWQARGVLALLLLLLFGFTILNVVLNFVGRDFMTALAEKNLPEFNRTLLIYLGVFVLATPVSVFYSFIRKKLGVNWRLWLTSHFLSRYFTNRAYYHINDDKVIDNPDQRISQDISSFTVTSLGFLSIIFFSLVQLISFIGILWSISVTLVLVLVAYATLGTVVTMFFGKRLIHLNFQQLRREADFRYGLVHIRDNAESIAFYRGEGREQDQVQGRLREVIGNLRMLIGWERNLEFFTKGYEYLILVLPVVIMAPLYFSGQIKFGVITQAESAFVQVLGALSIIVSQFEQLSNFAAGITRLETFAAAIDKPAVPPAGGVPLLTAAILSREEARIALENVTLQTPNREQVLLKNATAEVPPGGNLLIAGPSGAGKSSVLRAIAGLWNAGEGVIARPPLAEMLFLPQRPYMVLGSLREQLLYPHLDREATEEELRAILERVNLADLPDRVGGFDAVLDWSHLLSLGEQQRLAFARLLLSRPRYAVLDEATSALDAANEEKLYRLLQDAGTTYVSVGHRSSLVKYHDRVLELRGGGKWRLLPAAEFTAAASA